MPVGAHVGVLVSVRVGVGVGLIGVLVGEAVGTAVGPGVTALQFAPAGLEKQRLAAVTSPMLTDPLPFWSQLVQRLSGSNPEKICPQRLTSPMLTVPLLSQSPASDSARATPQLRTKPTSTADMAPPTVFIDPPDSP